MNKKIMTLLTVIASVYCVVCAYLYFNQTKLIFPTTKVDKTNEITQKLTLAINRTLTLEGGIITALNPDLPVVLVFGGNAQNVINQIEKHSQHVKNVHFIAFNYRGYGNSGGTPSAKSILSDAEKIYDHVKKIFPNNKLIVLGQSLGSTVATHIAANFDIDGLILLGPFDSLASMAHDRYPIFPTKMLIKHDFNVMNNVKYVKADTAVIRMEKDMVTPPKHTLTYINMLPEGVLKKEIVIPGNGHNIMFSHEMFYDVLKAL